MISMEKGQNLDAKLKEMEDEAKLVDIEMPSDKEEIVDLTNSNSSSTNSMLCFLSISKHIHSD